MFVSEVVSRPETKHVDLNGYWQFRKSGDDQWADATVPGCNFTDLLDNGVIDDPFYRTNENSLQWIEHCDWEYKKVFHVSDEDLNAANALLNFEGLDTYCDVYLNNTLIHQNENMFVGAKVSCLHALLLGKNELLVKFRSPINEVMAKHKAKGFTYPAENDKSEERLSVYSRKAPYHYGWDWGPRFVTSGIWRNVSIEFLAHSQISDIYVQQVSLENTQAHLVVNVTLNTVERFSGQLVIACDTIPQLTKPVAVSMEPGEKTYAIPLTIVNPKRWWPAGLGDAHLYALNISLYQGQCCISHQEKKVGLRTIEVVNEKDDMGESFFVKVNGYPTFMKGANYIPSDSFPSRVTSEKYRKVFEDAVAANMNMLRVWGGGIYEADEFYQLADEYGILIWQDFMFACSLYPADEAFLENVKAEVTYNVKRLRNHACLALWCGNNETEMGIEFWNWPQTFNYSDETYKQLKQEYDLLFKSVLPALVEQLDPERFYFSSSPIGFWEVKADDSKGDNHYWGVWHGEEPFSEFKYRIPRFMSEFGFQSFPLLSSVRHYSEQSDLHIESDVMKLHQKHPRGNALISSYMASEYKKPKNFESFLYVSQVQQALGMKIAFEAHRSAMPFCMGSLYWQFNDCWPVASWSGIDYYGKWKAMHYQVKRSFEPVAVFIDERDENIRLNLVSDKLEAKNYQLQVALTSLRGEVLWSQQQIVELLELSSSHVELSLSHVLENADRSSVILTASLFELESRLPISTAIHYFVPTKDLALESPTMSIRSTISDDLLVVSLKSDTLARQVYVEAPVAKENFSDNFFDLVANQEKVITLSIEQIPVSCRSTLLSGIKVVSIIDSHL